MTAQIVRFPMQRVKRWPLAGSPEYEWDKQTFADKVIETLREIQKHGIKIDDREDI